MNLYEMINPHLNQFMLPEDRVFVRRWLLEFLVANPRLSVSAAAQAGCQLLTRWGTDVLRESIDESWPTRPLPATRSEWSSDGYLVPENARPLVIHSQEGCRIELFQLFDVELVDRDRVGTIDHEAVREPAEPHDLAPTLLEFSAHLGARERAALSYLWRIAAVLEWADEGDSELPAWVEQGNHTQPCRPCPETGREEACFRILIHPSVEGPAVMHQVLSLVAGLLGALVQGRRERTPHRVAPVEQISEAEVTLVSHLVGLRMGFGSEWETAELDLPREIDWGRAVKTAQVLEDLLQGLPNSSFPVGGSIAGTPQGPPLLVLDPFREVERDLDALRHRKDRAIVEQWMLDFVARNGRFPLPTALALGWQLYQRWGVDVIGDVSRPYWIGIIELRSEDEWQVRGWVPRPDASALIAPSGRGREIHYFLRDDVIVADRLASLESESQPDPENLALYRPGPADAPELTEFRALIPQREVEMLRNLWRDRIMPCLPTQGGTDLSLPEFHGQPHHRLEVAPRAGQSATLAVLEELSIRGLENELGDAHGRLTVAWETAIVLDIVARRLGIEYEPPLLVEEAISRRSDTPLHWGPIFRTAATMENSLNGFPD